jgi:hypothetical protein
MPITLPVDPDPSTYVNKRPRPLLHLAPQLHVELWDENALTPNAFVAELRINLAADGIIQSEGDNLPPDLPTPSWYSLTRLDTGHTNNICAEATAVRGELLLNVQVRNPK